MRNQKREVRAVRQESVETSILERSLKLADLKMKKRSTKQVYDKNSVSVNKN